MALSRAGLAARNARVLAAAGAHETPLVVTMGGGYPSDLDEASAPFAEALARPAPGRGLGAERRPLCVGRRLSTSAPAGRRVEGRGVSN